MHYAIKSPKGEFMKTRLELIEEIYDRIQKGIHPMYRQVVHRDVKYLKKPTLQVLLANIPKTKKNAQFEA